MNKLMPLDWTTLIINEKSSKVLKKLTLQFKNSPNKIPGLLDLANKFYKTLKK